MDHRIISSLLILLLPLLTSVVLFLARKKISKSMIGGISAISSLSTLALAVSLFLTCFNNTPFSISFNWIIFPATTHLSWGLYLNNITLIMLAIVTGISFLVQLFSTQYMKNDVGHGRYFSFLNFFTFSMLGIVLASNLLMIFIFWELVGFASYLLIGFWFTRPAASKASKKAFIVNRIGDIGFLLGLLIIWSLYHTFDLKELEIAVNLASPTYSYLIFLAGLGLFAGCIGKSAQFPLQTWLPDAMEGPTPVSALIHAATMVAAGVFLLARVFFILDLDVLTVIAFMGAITAFMGAIAALYQTDIKKVLAYSTISQLGYMVMGIGLGAYQASFFHLITHAFFKAGLFLSAGAVIHALHQIAHHDHIHFDAQDMRLMGGLRKKLPLTFIVYCITTSALIGLPFTSGFLSKDSIITASLSWSKEMVHRIGLFSYLIPFLALITVFLTAFYMGRQIIMVFFGELRLKKQLSENSVNQLKEVPFMMKLPLSILGFFSLFFVFSSNPINPEGSYLFKALGQELRSFPSELFTARNIILTNIENHIPQYHLATLISSLALAIAGLFLAYVKYFYRDNFIDTPKTLLWKLSLNNWFLDYFYEKTIVKGIVASSEITRKIDGRIIDPFLNFLGYFTVIASLIIKFLDKILVDGVVNFTVYLTGRAGMLTRSFQGGKVQFYFITALISLVLLICLFAF